MSNTLIVVIVTAFAALAVGLILMRGRRKHASPATAGPRPQGRGPAQSPRSTSGKHWLVGVSPSLKDQSWHIGDRTVTVGRGVSNYIQINEDDASRVHCQVAAAADGLRVKDMQSRNGTLVNGVEVDECVLMDGDELQIGEAVLRYHPHASFRENAGLARARHVGTDSNKETQAVAAVGSMKQMAEAALRQSDGTVPDAAARLGVSPEVFVKMLQSD